MPRSKQLVKKRKFHGNRYTSTEIVCTPDVEQTSPNPEDRSSLRATCSSSKTKVGSSLLLYKQEDDDFEYNIIDLKRLESILESVAVCKICHCSIKINKKQLAGLACEVTLQCVSCDNKAVTDNCETIETTVNNSKLYDLNIRLVYGLRAIGKGRAAAEKFCGIMNLNPPVSKYHIHERYLVSRSESVCKQSMRKAVEEAVSKNDGCRDLSVAIDGSWQKRGHTSLNGIVSATSLESGKVLDIEILSKFCLCSNKLINIHEEGCSANFAGTSGAMEVAGAVKIFERSIPTYSVRYTDYLGDGDTKAYLEVCERKPYGPDIEIKKIECVGHIQKRMGTRLRTLKAKTKRLPDDTPLGGRNRLTDAAILKLQSYYGLAIRRNSESVKNMKEAIWAQYFHVMASNGTPQNHALCPRDGTTWCKFNLAKLQRKTYDHTEHFHLPVNIMSFIKPIFQDLAKPELLEKCLQGRTQNVNALNNVIWTYVPKKVFVGIDTLKFGVYEAVTTFNDGHIGKWMLFKEIGLRPGKHFTNMMKVLDRRRIAKAETAQQELEKKIRETQTYVKKKIRR